MVLVLVKYLKNDSFEFVNKERFYKFLNYGEKSIVVVVFD